MIAMGASSHPALRRFRRAYGLHREREGRGPLDRDALLTLPFLEEGRFAGEWAVRARSFRTFLGKVLEPLEERRERALRVLDLGAGNGWLSYRMVERGHRAIALDLRVDAVDGLSAAEPYRDHLSRMFSRIAGSFDALPLADGIGDLAVFNASLHYATGLEGVLAEAVRAVRAGGRLAVLDSPFYRDDRQGEAMVEEKRETAPEVFGDLADDLTALPSVEYLTDGRLTEESRPWALQWRRERVRYPLWYELRPVRAFLSGRRAPSRFDVWWTEVP